jgi:hypothetical protein
MGVWSGFYGGRNQQAGVVTAINPRHFSDRRAALSKGSKSGPIFSAKKVFLRARGFQRGVQSISGGGRPLFWGSAEKNRGFFEPVRWEGRRTFVGILFLSALC